MSANDSKNETNKANVTGKQIYSSGELILAFEGLPELPAQNVMTVKGRGGPIYREQFNRAD